jgi:AcrR family transcriptional regulator
LPRATSSPAGSKPAAKPRSKAAAAGPKKKAAAAPRARVKTERAKPARAKAELAKPERAKPARPRNREQTINDILDAAEVLLDKKGPDGFGLAELGRDAGVSFGLIHHYFGGKEGLLRAVLRRTMRELGREIRRIQEGGQFWEQSAPAVVVVFDTYLRKPGFARLMAWGLLKGLLNVEEVSLPGASRIDAAALTTLLTSAVLGFNLLRPLLVQTRGWNSRSDEILREQLVRAMISIARPRADRP